MARFHQGTAPTHPHTTVDHREGGPDVAVDASGDWIALAQFHTTPDRQPAVLASVETLMEQFGHERPVAEAFVMESRDGHRVVACLWLGGHDAFHALQSAWDQHHRHLAREKAGDMMTLALCHCTATSGEPLFAIGGKDVVTFAALPGAARLPTRRRHDPGPRAARRRRRRARVPPHASDALGRRAPLSPGTLMGRRLTRDESVDHAAVDRRVRGR